MIGYRFPRGRQRQRSRTDCIHHDGNPHRLRDGHFPEVDLGLAVVEDAPAAEDQQIEFFHLRPGFVTAHRTDRNRVLNLMAAEGVFRITRENSHLHRERRPKLLQDALENCLITQVQPTV